MDKITVNLRDRGYPIYIAKDFSDIKKVCDNFMLSGNIMVVTDSNVERHYLEDAVNLFSEMGAGVRHHVIPAGEKSKNLNTVSEIYRHLMSLHFDRSSILVALGGGVVGDITGFAAATFMRGIRFIQIPTTLLAQADSSVGGKTGVDFEGCKNMVGAFYQPDFVYINVGTLKTLPARELKSGLAEVIKHGLILDSNFFKYVDLNINKIFNFDANVLKYITKVNCSIKSKIVEQDEHEGDIRRILNFGHTIGHAVETISGFSMLHGECVSVGISGALRLSCKLGIIDEKLVEEVENTLVKAGLPIKARGMNVAEIFEAMRYDKKIRNGKLNLVLPKSIGEVIHCSVDDEEIIKEVLSELTV